MVSAATARSAEASSCAVVAQRTFSCDIGAGAWATSDSGATPMSSERYENILHAPPLSALSSLHTARGPYSLRQPVPGGCSASGSPRGY